MLYATSETWEIKGDLVEKSKPISFIFLIKYWFKYLRKMLK